jgi:1,4-dihydroxy-2-naphthoate polyprenyltransferase
MATPAQWIEGARPRTLPAAIAPVLVGTGAAAAMDGFVWWKALLALVVALALQVGVNYANDYSDGIRGTDAGRVGPFRLVGSGAAAASRVRVAAFVALGVGMTAGLVLALTSSWWLLAVGAAAVAAAWFYTGGSRPYGYRGLGEVAVFVFFGLVAVAGTTYVQAGRISAAAVAGGVAVGALACAILVVNNLRDIPTDRLAGKRTLAVLLGDRATRVLYVTLLCLPFALTPWLVEITPWTLVTLLALPLAWSPIVAVLRGASGRALIPVLKDTARAELGYGLLLTLALVLSRS